MPGAWMHIFMLRSLEEKDKPRVSNLHAEKVTPKHNLVVSIWTLNKLAAITFYI